MWPNKFNVFVIASVLIFFHGQITETQAEDKDIQCYNCDSSKNETCLQNVTEITEITGFSNCTDAKGCYVQVDTAGTVTRGCLADDAKCEDGCKKCTTDKCNNNNICKSCDSSKDGDCAQTDSSGVGSEICTADDTKCVIKINSENLATERHCATADEQKSCDNATCIACEAGNCNVGIFPTSRIRCYQCADPDGDCASPSSSESSIRPLPCLHYKATDACYMFGTSATTMQRGCVSDSNNTKCETPDSNEACVACTADNCNKNAYEYDQRLLCVTCNSKDDSNCGWTQSANTATSCKNKIKYNEEAMCYWQIHDKVTYRGCMADRDTSVLGTVCDADKQCHNCTDTDGCNSKDAGVFSCIRCRSDENAECRSKATELEGESCRNSVTKDDAECYYGEWHGVVIRGCLVDTVAEVKVVCKDTNNKQCETCDTQDCNTKARSGAATIASLSTGLLAILWLTLPRLL